MAANRLAFLYMQMCHLNQHRPIEWRSEHRVCTKNLRGAVGIFLLGAYFGKAVKV